MTSATPRLSAGDTAPDFSLTSDKDTTVSLSDFRGRRVVVYFYPKSFTKGCTVEAHAFAENADNFAAAGATLIGVSADKIETQVEFSSKECRDKFAVAADPDASIIRSYDALRVRPNAPAANIADRISYVIAPDRSVIYTYVDSAPQKHIDNTLSAVRRWRETHKSCPFAPIGPDGVWRTRSIFMSIRRQDCPRNQGCSHACKTFAPHARHDGRCSERGPDSLGGTPQLHKAAIDALLADPGKVLFVDLRRPDEVSRIGSFPVYLSAQIKDLDKNLDFIPKDRPIVTVSNHAGRAGQAGDLLSEKGFKVIGAVGSQIYEAEGGTIVKIAVPPETPTPAPSASSVQKP